MVKRNERKIEWFGVEVVAHFFLVAAFSAFLSALRISFSRSLRSFSCCRRSFSIIFLSSFNFLLNLALSSPVTPRIFKSLESNCRRAPPSTPCSRNFWVCCSSPSANSHWQTCNQTVLVDFSELVRGEVTYLIFGPFLYRSILPVMRSFAFAGKTGARSGKVNSTRRIAWWSGATGHTRWRSRTLLLPWHCSRWWKWLGHYIFHCERTHWLKPLPLFETTMKVLTFRLGLVDCLTYLHQQRLRHLCSRGLCSVHLCEIITGVPRRTISESSTAETRGWINSEAGLAGSQI